MIPVVAMLLASIGCAIQERPAQSRIEQRTSTPAAPDPALVAAWRTQFAARTFSSRTGASLPYRILEPAGRGRRPLVIVLHGSGGIGTDNQAQLGPFGAAWAQAELGDRPIVLVPQVASRSADYERVDGRPRASRAGPSFPLLLEFFDAMAADERVDPRRIYLVGFSMGGSAALQLALARPAAIAGLVSFAPVPPPVEHASRISRVAVTIVHGSADEENPFSNSQRWAAAADTGGRFQMIVYGGLDHRVPDDMLVSADWRRRLLTGRLP